MGDPDDPSNAGGEPQNRLTQRDGKRSEVSIPTLVRDSSGGSYEGEIENLSARGCRVRFATYPTFAHGRVVTVGIEGIEAQGATVAWSKGNAAGFEFVHPLYEAVFESLAQRHPAAELVVSDSHEGWMTSD